MMRIIETSPPIIVLFFPDDYYSGSVDMDRRHGRRQERCSALLPWLDQF
jgi:hypothetical protein